MSDLKTAVESEVHEKAEAEKGDQLEASVVSEQKVVQVEVIQTAHVKVTVELPDNVKAKVAHYQFKEVESKTIPEAVEGSVCPEVPEYVAVPKVVHFPGAKYWATFQAAPGQERGIFNRFGPWRRSLWDMKFKYTEGGRNLNCHAQAAGESFKTLKDAEQRFFEVVGSKPEKHFV